MNLFIHSFVPRSQANGPGVRAVVWVQGCTLACRGCFNADTHPAAGQQRPVAELLAEIARLKDAGAIEGITISGGEPLQQPEPVAELAAGAHALGLSVVLFTGYTIGEVTGMAGAASSDDSPGVRAARESLTEAQRRAVESLFDSVDVLLAGRYNPDKRIASGLRGSSNKRAIFLSDRYTLADIEQTPPAEIIIGRGRIVRTGIEPAR